MAANPNVVDTTKPEPERWPQASPEYWAQGNRLRRRPSDGFFDCEIQLRKERRRITLRVRSKFEAQIEAARAWLLIRRNGWEAWDFNDPPLWKLVDWVEKELWKRGTSPQTTKQYKTAIWSLMRREVGLDGPHKFGRGKSRDKRAERDLFRDYCVSFLTSKRTKKWYQDYPTQAEAAKYLFQPSILVHAPWRIKRPFPFRRPGECNDSTDWYPRPW